MYRLENAYLSAEFDDQARLVLLQNNREGTGNIIDAPAEDSFLLVFKKGDDWENAVFGRNQSYRVEHSPDKICFICDSCVSKRAIPRLTLRLSAQLDGAHLRFGAEIKNEDDILVTDFSYPMVGAIRSLSGEKPMDLLWPNQCGERYLNIGEHLSIPPIREREPHAGSLCLSYPGVNGSMQWAALTDDEQTLAISGRDPMFYASEFRAKGSDTGSKTATLMLTRFAFVKAGESWKAPPILISLYHGDWHRAAREYREWAETWRNVHPVAEWIKDMRGYFLVINKQQFGTEMWRYDEIPKLYELAQAHGYDALGLFGWYDSGHDNQYPDLEISDSLGGKESLMENIRSVQERGGHVTLYQQGHLIDVTSSFYKNGGQRYESVSRWGTPYYENYNKSHRSHFLEHFTNKTFATSCPSCPEWQELMEQKAEWVASFGANGVLFDQIGGMPPYPCFNEEHPHVLGKPSLSMSQGRLQLLDRIQKKTKQIDPEYAFMTEHVTDVYSAFADCLHGIGLYPFPKGQRGRKAEEGRTECVNYPELFRYCFPGTAVTVRNGRPFMEPRLVNYGFLFGLRMEMEIRYQADKEDILADRWPEYREYAKKADALRARYWDLFGRGEYRDTDLLENGCPGLLARCFVRENRMAAALWNDTEEPISLGGFSAPGWRLIEASTVEKTSAAMPGSLQPGQILAALYEKEEEAL